MQALQVMDFKYYIPIDQIIFLNLKPSHQPLSFMLVNIASSSFRRAILIERFINNNSLKTTHLTLTIHYDVLQKFFTSVV